MSYLEAHWWSGCCSCKCLAIPMLCTQHCANQTLNPACVWHRRMTWIPQWRSFSELKVSFRVECLGMSWSRYICKCLGRIALHLCIAPLWYQSRHQSCRSSRKGILKRCIVHQCWTVEDLRARKWLVHGGRMVAPREHQGLQMTSALGFLLFECIDRVGKSSRWRCPWNQPMQCRWLWWLIEHTQLIWIRESWQKRESARRCAAPKLSVHPGHWPGLARNLVEWFVEFDSGSGWRSQLSYRSSCWCFANPSGWANCSKLGPCRLKYYCHKGLSGLYCHWGCRIAVRMLTGCKEQSLYLH